jgi:prepilin-type N-terminal cleavage/methylation domain-containing protein
MATTKDKTAATRAADGQRGFTLIEILVTLAVTLIGLAGLMTLHHVISQGNSSAGRTTEASAVAESALEEVRQIPFATLESRFGVAPIDVELEEATGKGDHVYQRQLLVEPIDAVSPDLFRVRLEVSWTEDGAAAGSDNGAHDHTFVLETLRTRQEVL